MYGIKTIQQMAKILCVLAVSMFGMVGFSYAQSIVGVRSNDTAVASRMVFYFPNQVTYDVTEDAATFTLRFQQEIYFDFGLLQNTPLTNISNPAMSVEAAGSVVVLNIVEGSSVAHFYEGNKLVVEVTPPPPPPEEVEVDDAQQGEEGAEADQGDGTEGDTTEAGDAAPQEDGIPTEADAADDAQTAEEIAQANPTDGQPLDEADLAAIDNALIETNTGPAAQTENGELILPVNIITEGTDQTITFDWTYPVAAAVFKRAGYLWVVFDETARADLSGVQSFLNDKFRTVEQTAALDQLMFRFELTGESNVFTTKEGNQWRVTLGDEDRNPLNLVGLTRQEQADSGMRIFVSLEDPGPHLRINDPEVGDDLEVIPVVNPSMGAGRDRLFAQFQVLKSAQGLVIQRLSDQVVVSRFSNGVAIGSLAQLAVSDSPLNTQISTAASEANRPIRLVDFEIWRNGEDVDFINNRKSLAMAASLAEEADINAVRWDMARFYLGFKMASEALSILDLMVEADPDLITDPKYRAIRGLSLIYLRRYDEAEMQLQARELDAEPDIYLWRHLVHEAKGEYQDALDDFAKGRDSIASYETDKIVDFRMAAIRAALAIAQFDSANWELSLIRRLPLTRYQKADVDFLEGKLLEMMGENVQALSYYQGINEQDNRRASANARFAAARLQQQMGTITTDQAMDELERLKYSWRGDALELDILHMLGTIYLEEKDYRQGLNTLRMAVTSFPESEITRGITNEMVESFRALFLDGGGEELPAVTALSLYYDFRELTPLGAEGDQMVRRLADRLVGVDLLERASELLDHQVKFRLTGAAQAVIASRLAKIYLLDHKPEEALEILRITRQTTLPDDVMRERTLVEARTLNELGQYEEAEVLLDGMIGDDVLPLLVDIFWGAQKWDAVADTTFQILNNRWQDPTPLTLEERQYLIRNIISLSLQGERGTLDNVRTQYEAFMQEGRFSNAFDIITSPEDHTSEEIRDVVRRTASVDSFQTFMSTYRDDFAPQANAGAVPQTN